MGRESWFWTVTASSGLCIDMDEDTLDLISKLCTRAGMIMEDASVDALTIPPDGMTMGVQLANLNEAARTIASLLAAASTLHRYRPKPDEPYAKL